MSATIAASIQRLRATYDSGLTRPLAWRQQQLLQLQQLLQEHEAELLAALKSDLGKSNAEGWLTELGYLQSDIKYTLKHLKSWMKPQRVRQPLLAWPGRSF